MGKSRILILNGTPLTLAHLFPRNRLEPSPAVQTLYPPHQLSNGCVQRFGNSLNCEEAWIFHAPLNAAQEGSINVGFCGKRLLRKLPLPSDFTNTLPELFGYIVAHLHQLCPFATSDACRLYTTSPLDNYSVRWQNRPHLTSGIRMFRHGLEMPPSSTRRCRS
jgi:hypothetical protein